jgi:hypothetical protein
MGEKQNLENKGVFIKKGKQGGVLQLGVLRIT